MKSIKRGLALLLAAVLITQTVQVSAEETVSEETLTEDAVSEETPAEESSATDEILYNTGNIQVKVVSPQVSGGDVVDVVSANEEALYELLDGDLDDPEVMQKVSEWTPINTFGEDGSCTIEINEADPFFPYEVQFTYNGETINKWFMTPDSSVEVGGHTFRVNVPEYCYSGEVVTQMSLNVAGKEVTVYPEEKEFTNDVLSYISSGISTMSLLPLTEKSFTADLTGLTPIELTQVSIGTVFTGKTLADTDKIVWKTAYTNAADYTISDSNDTIPASYSGTLEMIVGDGDQLNPDNIRYIVSFSTTSASQWLIPTVYKQDEAGNRTNLKIYDSKTYYSKWSNREFVYVSSAELLNRKTPVYVSIEVNSELFPDTQYDHLKVFEGQFSTAEEALAAPDITDQVLCKDMTQKDAGYPMKSNNVKGITMVAFNADDSVMGVLPFDLYLGVYQNTEINAPSGLMKRSNDSADIDVSSSYGYYSYRNNAEHYDYTIYTEFPEDGIYYSYFSYTVDGEEDNSLITAAYAGNYTSIAEAEAAGAENIKEILFDSSKGYGADYSNGVYFSIFEGKDGIEQNVYRYCITAKSGTTSKYMDHYTSLMKRNDDGTTTDVLNVMGSSTKDGVKDCTYTLYSEFPADGKYYKYFNCAVDVTAAYAGNYTSIAEAEADGAEDIKEILFDSSKGYEVDYSNGVYFSIFIGEDGIGQNVYRYCITTEQGTNSKYISNPDCSFVKRNDDGTTTYIEYSSSSNINENGVKDYTYTLYSEFPADGQYYKYFGCFVDGVYDISPVMAAYVGNYTSIAEAEAAGAEDIKEILFDSSKGYEADYSNSVYFSIFTGEEGQNVYRYCITAEQGTISKYPSSTVTNTENALRSGTAVSFKGLLDKNGNKVSSYSVEYYDDSFGENNYRTIIVGPDVDLTYLVPEFTTSEGVNLYAPGSSSPEVSGQDEHDFSDGPVQYTASAENGKASANYWLSVIKATEGAGQIYINSLYDAGTNTKEENGVIYSDREVMLDSYHSNRHDILVANMGTEAIENLTVDLVSDELELDDYWTFTGKSALQGFSTTSRTTSNGELPNLAKIRLKAKSDVENGTDITGTLTIKSGDTPLVVLNLTGTAGDPVIETQELPQAVKYVPYGTMIQNNNKYSWNTISYEVTDGELPEGMTVKPNGEIYGVPKESGEFTFTVTLNNSYSAFISTSKTFTLVVADNTDTDVDGATDEGYELKERIPDIDKETDESNYLMVSEGKFEEFVDLFLDGDKLVLGQDYDAESGSTRITIQTETLKSVGDGTHTLGIEFRDADNSLMRAAQNYRIEYTKNDDTGIKDNNTDIKDNNTNNEDTGDKGNNSSNEIISNNKNNTDNTDNKTNTNNNSNSVINTGNGENVSDDSGRSDNENISSDTASAITISTVSYTVTAGDTLSKIAQRFYGSSVYWKKIYTDNAATIKNPNKIYVGQVITIYLNNTAVSTTGNTASTDTVVSGGTYTVVSGDNLWKIAQKVYGQNRQWRRIYDANRKTIKDPGHIYVGQVLTIPED